MEVVRKNFKETLPLITESIKKADFLSIDAEFTGLINGRDVSIFDSPADCYIRLLNGSNEFLLIQFGLCAFYWDEDTKHYMNDAYNFYLFPRGRPGPDRMFLCQSSSLEFLAANGFDFNKLIKEGISYMTMPLETKLRENLTERQLNSASKEKDPVRIPDENRQQIEDICKRVKAFIDDKKEDEMEIDKCNSFVRMLLFQELKLRFKNDVLLDSKASSNNNNYRVIQITRKKDELDQESIRKKREWDELEDAVGFSKVARMISQSEKLVVGHNMLLDVIHTLSHFFQDLSNDYQCFKEFAHCMFPKLLDTKFMSSSAPFKDKINSSVLKELLSTLSQPPYSLPKVESLEGRGYSHLDAKEHEAGYDAYITGLCLLAMNSHLSAKPGEVVRLDSQSNVLKPYMNKLFLAKTARQDSPYINLDGVDPSPSRDHVFHMVFPKEWLRNDINQLFSPFGAVIVQFINDESAYVALDRRDKAVEVQRALTKNSLVKLTPFHKFKQLSNMVDNEMAAQRRDRSKRDAYKLINTTGINPRQGSKSLPSWTPPPLPEKVSRDRSNSTSIISPPTATRKRTSSGVFQVDESEPLPKKTEVTRSLSVSPQRRPEEVQGGRQGTTENQENGQQVKESSKKEKEKSKKNKNGKKGKESVENIKEKVIEKFDSKAKSNCVSAFKESDSWE